MQNFFNIIDFLEPVSVANISQDEDFKPGQLGDTIKVYDGNFPDLSNTDIVLVGCGEQRGSGIPVSDAYSANAIRQQLYRLYHWHDTISIGDAGNVKTGRSYTDTYAALKTVVHELIQNGKKVIILGGSHDLTLAQYQAYVGAQKQVEAINADALIDINDLSIFRHENFLMEMLTGEPNYVSQYNHIGFQSYLAHPGMLQTLDKLGFDCLRVGKLQERMEEAEPLFRNSHLFSLDVNCIAAAYAPANHLSPNGFTGAEACMLMQYAGMSNNISTVGLYGFNAHHDVNELTARQLAQMIWYYMDGLYTGKKEASLTETTQFYEFFVQQEGFEIKFVQSKKTGRWWMQLPDEKYIACSKADYIIAANNELPERWLRAQERV